MTFDVNNPYFRTQVLTASPEALRLLLIDGCLRFLRAGREALEARDHEKVHENLTNARAVLVELSSSLKREVDPALCDRLEAIYTYILRLTVDGSFQRDAGKLDEAISLMDYDRETWVLAMGKAGSEARKTEGGRPESPAAPGLCVQG